MSFRWVVGTFGGLVAFFVAGAVRAECTKDTECKGDRICEAGSCVAPPPTPEKAPGSPVDGGTAPAPPPAEPALAPAPAPAPAVPAAAPPEAPPAAPKMKRRSPGMMVGGIFLASAGPIVVLLGSASTCSGVTCESNAQGTGLIIAGIAMIGLGVPLIVMGAQKVPDERAAPSATLSPWVGPDGAGASVRLAL